MKSCGYCGRENGDESVHCRECETLLIDESAPLDGGKTLIQVWEHTNPAFRHALKAGVGIVLILTAIILTIGRLTLDSAEAELGTKIGRPGIYGVGILVMAYTLPVLAFSIPLLGLNCVVQCKSFGIGLTTTVLAVMAVVLVARPFKVFLPVIFLGRIVGASGGYYAGAFIQLLVGAWLLGWFDQWIKRGHFSNRGEPRSEGTD